jgi:hypothetical protein
MVAMVSQHQSQGLRLPTQVVAVVVHLTQAIMALVELAVAATVRILHQQQVLQTRAAAVVVRETPRTLM